jgi:hypothetical protein
MEHDDTDRLSRLSAVITEALEASPDYGDDIKGIFALNDGHSSGAAMLGYEDHITPDPVFDLIKFAGILFASIGIKMNLVADNSEGAKVFDIPQPPLAGDGTGESVTLTVFSDPYHVQMAGVCRAVKEGVEQAEGDWSQAQVIISVALPESGRALLYHGIEGSAELAHQLLHLLQQVFGSEGGQIVLVPLDTMLGTGPN